MCGIGAAVGDSMYSVSGDYARTTTVLKAIVADPGDTINGSNCESREFSLAQPIMI